MPQAIHIDGPPPGLMRSLAEMQQRINEEYSALTPEQRAKRAKEDLAYMPGQAYLLGPDYGDEVVGEEMAEQERRAEEEAES